MGTPTIVRKVIDGVLYTYDRTLDIITDGTPTRTAFLNRTSVTRPVDICVECTTWCNLTCENCFSESERGRPGRHGNVAEILRYLIERSNSFIRVCLTGGEPLLHPRIEKLLGLPEIIRDCGYVLTTNGTVRTELDGILREHQWLIAVSLHGSHRTHEAYTSTKTFHLARRRIEKLAPTTPTHIYTVLHDSLTEDDVEWLLQFRRESGATFLRFIVPRPFGRYAPLTNKELLRFVKRRCDSNCAIKREPSQTTLFSISGQIRPSA